jgi:hypothetical protein
VTFPLIGPDQITHEFHALTRMADLLVIRLHDCRIKAASITRKFADSSDYSGWEAGSLPSDLKTRDTHLARFARYARYARNIPETQDEAARLMSDILTPIPIDLISLKPKS